MSLRKAGTVSEGTQFNILKSSFLNLAEVSFVLNVCFGGGGCFAYKLWLCNNIHLVSVVSATYVPLPLFFLSPCLGRNGKILSKPWHCPRAFSAQCISYKFSFR